MLVVEVKFSEKGRVYYFDGSMVESLNKGDFVIVDHNEANEFAEIVAKPKNVENFCKQQELKKVVRKATEKDKETHNNWIKKEKDAIPIIEKSVQKFELKMKLVEVKYNFDGSKLLVVYTADERVDFRELVRELASKFKTRIELRQIGFRDEAKMCGGCGACGQELCCRRFLSDYTQVTIKMAKTQNLALNPNKINGVCGKLMCCLEYEYPEYKQLQDKMPPIGSVVLSPDGEGEVVYHDFIKEEVMLKFKKKDKDDIEKLKSYTLDKLKF